MSLRHRDYLSEIKEPSPERLYSHRGAITDWKYPVDGVKAGDLLRSGKAKLVRGPANRVYLKVQGGKEYRVKAGLAKGIKKQYWRHTEDES